MSTIVIYKTKYGSTKDYAEWIAEAIGCEAVDAKTVKVTDLLEYDTIIYGGGLYAEVINGITLITKNLELFKDKNIVVFTTGITPPDCRDYYDKLVIERNFKTGLPENVKLFNYMGKMVMDELTVVHRTAIKALKKLMSGKENPTEMEKMLVSLCDMDGDYSNKTQITELLEYVKEGNNK